MAKRHGTHAILRDQERFLHELIERKFDVSVDVRDFQEAVTRGGGNLIIYSGEYAVLFRDGKRWDVIRHGIADPTDEQMMALDLSRFQEEQMPPMEGNEDGVLGVGAL